MARLRELIAEEGDASALKKNLAACLAPSPGERRDDTAIDLERIIPPPANPLSPEFQKVSDVNKQLRAQIALLVMQPEDRSVFCAVLLLIEEMADAVSRIPEHAVARLVLNLQAMVRDGIQRPTAPDARILHGITQASDLLSHVLHHDILARAANLPPPQIVAVDDDKDLLPLIIAALESAMLPTIGCVDARAALDTLQETRCDLILMDVGLPDLNGFDTCACIRALPKHERTPIVFLTGQDTHENRTRGSLKGASDFIGKPFNVFELALKAHTWALKNQLTVD
jgi:CheY-like chemotaxis protein